MSPAAQASCDTSTELNWQHIQWYNSHVSRWDASLRLFMERDCVKRLCIWPSTHSTSSMKPFTAAESLRKTLFPPSAATKPHVLLDRVSKCLKCSGSLNTDSWRLFPLQVKYEHVDWIRSICLSSGAKHTQEQRAETYRSPFPPQEKKRRKNKGTCEFFSHNSKCVSQFWVYILYKVRILLNF